MIAERGLILFLNFEFLIIQRKGIISDGKNIKTYFVERKWNPRSP
jgi:hypothetical protein